MEEKKDEEAEEVGEVEEEGDGETKENHDEEEGEEEEKKKQQQDCVQFVHQMEASKRCNFPKTQPQTEQPKKDSPPVPKWCTCSYNHGGNEYLERLQDHRISHVFHELLTSEDFLSPLVAFLHI